MSDPIITMPTVPVVGLPAGEKDQGQRVDFKPTKFDLLIENKGYLLAWTRASVCPCRPVTEKSSQPDPDCPLCGGEGWFYFGGNQDQDLDDYKLDQIQQKIVTDSGAMLIRGIVTSVANNPDTLDRLGHWERGSLNLTVRAQNKVGLYDRVVVLDPEIVFSEVRVADGTDELTTRYLVTGVNHMHGATVGGTLVEYEAGVDYERSEDGGVIWYPSKEPALDTRIAIHYTCHPTFLIYEHPHVVRTTLLKFKKSPADLKTPLGDATPLPIQAAVRYEFLPSKAESA